MDRRQVLKTLAAAATVRLAAQTPQPAPAQPAPQQTPGAPPAQKERRPPQVIVFSQNLNQIEYPELGDIVKQTGVDGVDLSVRPGGHVEPRLANVDLVRAFEPVHQVLGSPRERAVIDRVYASLESVNFSERVLEPSADRLGVVRLKGIEWSDWGNAERVFATIRRTGWRPAWLERVCNPEGGLLPFPSALSA